MLFLSNLQFSAKVLNFINLKIAGLSSDRVLMVYLKLLISLHVCRSAINKWWINFWFSEQNKSLQMSCKSPDLGIYKESKSRLTEINLFYSSELLTNAQTYSNEWSQKCGNNCLPVSQLHHVTTALLPVNPHLSVQLPQVPLAGECTEFGPYKLIYVHHWPVQEHPLNLGLSGFD